jgi:hypothetical protein
MSVKRLAVIAVAFALTTGVVVAQNPSASGGAASAQAKKKSAAKPRVFFIEPKNGATVKSPVRLKFGVSDYTIAAVPPGTVERARPGVGHHHVGVDTDCLPPGTIIPKAAPWIHFGDGKDEIDMQLPPGRHKLALEIGDDEHRTQPGLCTTITVNVKE